MMAGGPDQGIVEGHLFSCFPQNFKNADFGLDSNCDQHREDSIRVRMKMPVTVNIKEVTPAVGRGRT